MPTISAANNLTIRYDDDHWRLFAGRAEGVLPVAEAGTEGFAYGVAFGTARRLASDGLIPADHITMVVVGWAVEDAQWHLGLLLSPELAEARSGRWCGLAHWDYADGDQAERTGQALAGIMHCPFKIVHPTRPPGSVEQGEEPTHERIVSHVPLLPLPIQPGEWQLREDEMIGLMVERSASWRRSEIVRGIGYLVLTAAFGALSIGALTTRFAAVQPDWLPLIGIAVSAIMLLIALSHFLANARALTTIIDSHLSMVRQSNNPRRTANQMPFESVESIIVSHVINRREKTPILDVNGERHDKVWAEVWIHLNSPRRGFTQICYLSNVEGQVLSGIPFNPQRELNLGEINTPVHHIAMYIAERMNIPAYAEER